MSEQRSKEWFNQRLGRFTASEIHKLLGIKGLGLTGEDYAFKKACEIVFGRDEEDSFTTFDMQRGINLEPIAFDTFKRIKELDFVKVQKSEFFPNGENSGSSPDGLVGDYGVLEIKCPKADNLFKLVNGGDIKKEYMAQMQKQMQDTKSKKCYFFNYIIFNGKEMHHTIEVERDEVMIDFIESRIKEAVIVRDQFVVQLKNNIQFDLS